MVQPLAGDPLKAGRDDPTEMPAEGKKVPGVTFFPWQA